MSIDATLSNKTQNWLAAVLNEPLKSALVLAGATSATVYKIQTKSRTLFLRLLTNGDWLKLEPDLAPHEAAVLTHIQTGASSHLYPQVVAFDEKGLEAGIPAILTTWLPGKVDLHPADRETWIKRMAIALADIHQLEIDPAFQWRYRDWFDREALTNIEFRWSSNPQAWKRMVSEVALQAPPPYQPVFLHRDYHPTNVMWKDSEISGIVDWINGCVGPPLVDVGHCRLNLACMFGLEEADLFLASYLEANRSVSYDSYWDKVSLCNFDLDERPSVYSGWADFGLHNITQQDVIDRLDRFVISLEA